MERQNDLIYIIIGNLNNSLPAEELETHILTFLLANSKKYTIKKMKSTPQGDLYCALWVDPRDLYSWYLPITHPMPVSASRQLNPMAPHWLCTPCIKFNNVSAKPRRYFSSKGKIKYNICTGCELYITNMKIGVTAAQVAERLELVKTACQPIAVDKFEFLCRITFASPQDRRQWLQLGAEQLGLFPSEWALPGQENLLLQAPHPLSQENAAEATADHLLWEIVSGGCAPLESSTALSASTSLKKSVEIVAEPQVQAAAELVEEEPAEEIRKLLKVSERIQIYESWRLGVGGASVVFAGMWDRFRAAIKRFDKSQISESDKESWLNEVEILMDLQSADATNIVRVFGFEDSPTHFYLAMEKCEFSLLDAIPPRTGDSLALNGLPVETREIREWVSTYQHDTDVYYRLCVLMRGFLKGLLVLHTNRVIHRDVSPGNLLFLRDSYNAAVPLIAKIADMHISNKLDGDQTGKFTTFSRGKDGWRAPEILVPPEGSLPKATLSTDIFQAGMLLFYTFSGGYHLFQPPNDQGVVPPMTPFQIMSNIAQGKNCLHLIERDAPELFDLIKDMVDADPSKRPSIHQICSHPFVWSEATSINFLLDASAFLFESNSPEGGKPVFKAEMKAADCLKHPVFDDWLQTARSNPRLNAIFTSLPAYSTNYNPSYPLHLLRFARNAIVHFTGLFQSREDAYRCIRSTFPHLLTTIWRVMDCMRPHPYNRYYTVWGGEIR